MSGNLTFGTSGVSDAQRAFEAFDGSMLDMQMGESGFKPLNDIELKSIVAGEITDAVGSIFSGSEIAEARRQALRLFFGKPLGNEVPGRSQVVMTEVADTIHWIMPSLMRMFTGGSVTAEYCATNEQEEEQARQATEIINQFFREEADGFMLLYEWFFTALLERRSFVKVWMEERVEPEIRTYAGLTEREFSVLMEETPDATIMEYDERTETFRGEQIPVIDVTLRTVRVRRELKIRGIPPEEFLIARRESTLDDDTWFAGERRRLYSSDLIAMGFAPEFIRQLPVDEDQEFALSRIERLHDEQDYPARVSSRRDLASREHWVNDCYMRVDYDGDGFAELRRVMVIGDEAQVLMENEYANFMPYASLTAFPVPFKFHGLSIADIVGDLQRIKSTLWRQTLDNIYLQNNPRHAVLRGAVALEDMLQSRPGGVVRVNTLDAIKSLDIAGLDPRIVASMMDKLDEIKETRTGVSPNHQGIDAASLKGGATGVSAHLAAAQARVELIGRIFAETGVRQLFHLILRTLKQEGAGKTLSMKIGEKWIDADPSQWNDRMKVRVKVGLGVGAATERISYLMAMINLQQQAIQQGAGFLTTPWKVYKTLGELTKAMGYDREDLFFSEPEKDATWPAPPPDPRLLESERRSREDEMRNAVDQLKVQVEALDKEGMREWRMAELDRKDQWERDKNETTIKVAEIQASATREASERRPNAPDA